MKFWSCDLLRLRLSVISGNSDYAVSTFLSCGIKILFPDSNLGVLMDPFVPCLVGMTPSEFNAQGIENYLS